MSLPALWTGLLGAPIVWFIYLQINYVLATSACASVNKSVLGMVTAVAIVLSLGAAVTAWRCWREMGSSTETEAGDAAGRSRFLALSGLGVSAFFTLLLIANAIPIFILQACD